MSKKKRIGVKIGSSQLTNGSGEVREEVIIEICSQVNELLKCGYEVFLVSSGAVHSCPVKNLSKNLRASAGQVILISKYMRFFQIYKIIVAMILLTDYDLEHHHILKKTMLEAFAVGFVPLINANDPVDNMELKELKLRKNLEDCADNDKTFGRLCEIVEVDLAIIGIDQPGLVRPDKKIVRNVKPVHIERVKLYAQGGGSLGHGGRGMETKVEVCGDLAMAGISTRLVPTQEKDFLVRAVNNEKNFGTFFIAA